MNDIDLISHRKNIAILQWRIKYSLTIASHNIKVQYKEILETQIDRDFSLYPWLALH